MSDLLHQGLLAGYALQQIRGKLAGEPFRSIYADIVQRTHKTAADDLTTDRLINTGWCHSKFFTPGVIAAGFVALIDEDRVAIDHVERQIGKLLRVYADPPDSFHREFPDMIGKASAYFSNAHTCMAVNMCRNLLGEEIYSKFRRLVREHLIEESKGTEYFLTHFNGAHNAVATHAISGGICALTMGEESGYPDTEKVIQLGRDACEIHVKCGYDEQGTPHEGPMYSLASLEYVFLYASLLKQQNRENLFKTLPKMARIVQAYTEMQLPGNIGIIGFDDCRKTITAHPMPWLMLTAREYDRPQDLSLWTEWTEYRSHLPGKSGKCFNHLFHTANWMGLREILWWDGAQPGKTNANYPKPNAFFGEGKGIAVLRSSWKEDAVCVTINGQGRSHNIPDHTHADAGHFSIYARNELLAYDTGYYNFGEDTHSVVLIDDNVHYETSQGNPFTGRMFGCQSNEFLDYCCVDATSAKGCMWAFRHFLFVRIDDSNAYLVILDNINRDNGVHSFKWQLQAEMNCQINILGPTQARVKGKNACLDCHFFNPQPDDFPAIPHKLTVYSDDHEHKHIETGDPENNPRLVAEQKGCNCTLASVIVPRSIDMPPFNVAHGPAYRTFDIDIEHGQRRDRIIFACDHAYVRLPDLHASSEVCFIRYDQHGRILNSWTDDGDPVCPQ